MTKTLDYAAKKWAEKTPARAKVWKDAVTIAAREDNYSKGMEAFVGRPIRPELVEAWKAGVERVSEEDFRKAVENAAKLDKYRKGILRKVAAM